MNSSRYSKHLVWIILFGILWVKAASVLSIPFLTLFLSKNTKLSASTIGIIVGLQPLALCFSSVLGGYFSDIFKRYTIILFSIIISGFVYLGFYLVSNYLSTSLQICGFVVLNLLNGFSSALFSPVSRAIISDVTTDAHDNIKFLHLRYLALNLGSAIGPVLGAYAGIAGSSKAFLITSILYFIYALILVMTLKQYNITSVSVSYLKNNNFLSTLKYIFKNKLFIVLLLSLIIFNIIYVQLSTNLGLVINKNITNGTIFFSWMLSLNALIVIVCQPLIYLIVKNRNQKYVMLFGYLIILFCSFILVFLPYNKLSIILFVICLTICEMLVFPTGSILAMEFTAEEYRGTAFGAIDLEYFGSAIGPAIGGIVIQNFASNGFFWFILILSFLSLLIYWPYTRFVGFKRNLH